MSWPDGYWYSFFLEDPIIDELNHILDTTTEFRGENLTRNGRQTDNVLDKVDIGKIEIPFALGVTQSNDSILDRPFETVHIHLIDYDEDGYQIPHDHRETEDFSFIIYLNDSDQQTAFYKEPDYMYVTPEKGKAIFFPSNLLHWTIPGTMKKRVAVGAVKYLDATP